MSLPIIVQLFRVWMYAGKRIYVYAIGILNCGFGHMRNQYILHVNFENLFLFELAPVCVLNIDPSIFIFSAQSFNNFSVSYVQYRKGKNHKPMKIWENYVVA